jgi:hypothetical protein
MTSIITDIWNDVVKDFDTAEAWIDTQVQKVEAVFPAATATINALGSDVKQGASDAIGAVDSALDAAAGPTTTAVEAAADALLTKYTGGLALPLTGLTNDGILKIANLIKSTADSWTLKAQAALAENNATTGAAPAPTTEG